MRRASRIAPIAGVTAVLLAGILAVLAFVTPGFLLTRVFDEVALEQSVQLTLTADYGLVVDTVDCPPGIEVVVGATFECRAVVGSRPVSVANRVLSTDGDYEVGRPAGTG